MSFDYLTYSRKKTVLRDGWGNEERGVLVTEKPNQGVRERKKVGNRLSRRSQYKGRINLGSLFTYMYICIYIGCDAGD
jgi:hypothetical protein